MIRIFLRWGMNLYKTKLIYPNLSFKIVGICFQVHNKIGRFGREKQYSDFLEKKIIESEMKYRREFVVENTGNRVDFIIEDKILLELKAKPIIQKMDYYQTQRYLQILNLNLGLLINFGQEYLRPKRILKTEKDVRKKIK